MNRRDSENLLGSVETFHCVILATGYQHHFSFITDESLRLRISGNAGLDTYRNKGLPFRLHGPRFGAAQDALDEREKRFARRAHARNGG